MDTENKIICKFEFGLDLQKVILYFEGKEKVYWMNLNYISTFIADHPEVKNVYLYGSQDFLEKIELKTKEKEVTKKYAIEDCHIFIYNK